MNRLWTEEECIILNHVDSEAWTSEERSDMNGPWTEEQRIIFKHLGSEAWISED